MMIKKELLQEALPIPINAPHDIWLAFKACTISGIKYVDIVLTKYRQHSKTVTQTTYKKDGNKKSRARIERYKEFEEKLSWINLLKENERPQLQPFYQSLSVLYTKKRTGKFVWPLFYFLIKNIDFIFMFRSKKLSSKIIECRKLARGEQQ